MQNYDLVIIGAGPAGIAAAIYARERNIRTLVLEKQNAGGQLVSLYPDKNVYDVPSYKEIKAGELARKMVEHAYQAGVEIIDNLPVTGMSAQPRRFIINTGTTTHEAKTILLATGMGHYRPRQLGVRGESELKDKGVIYQQIPQKVTGKRIVVVGGGDTALEMVVAASEKGAAAVLVHRSQEFKAQEKTVDKARSLSIPMYLSAVVQSIQGNDKVDAVEIRKASGATSLISADYVCICIGVELSDGLLKELGIATRSQAIAVNSDMQTNQQGIFACGDLVVPAGKYRRITVAWGTAAAAINGIYQYLKSIPNS